MPELNTLSPKKWSGNYSGIAPTIDTTDGVYVGDLAIDTSNGNRTWKCVVNTNAKPIWIQWPSSRHSYGVYHNGCIYGKACFQASEDIDHAATYYAGNATARNIATTNTPYFVATKAVTAVQGVMWTYMGGSKGGPVASLVGAITGLAAAGTGFRLGVHANSNTNLAIYNWFCMGIHDGSLTGMKAVNFKYTGNASDNRALTGLGFTPQAVLVKSAAANYACFRNKYHAKAAGAAAGDLGAYCLYGSADAANFIQSMDADGFTIGTNAVVNTNAVVYHGIAFASDAAGATDIALTRYSGMAGDGCYIELPFQPNAVFAIPAGTNDIVLWTTTMIAGNTGVITSAVANLTDGIMSADAYGILIGSGTETNTVNNTVNLVALKTDTADVTMTG